MRVRRLLVPYAALALLLAGCGGDSTADPPGPSSGSPTATSSTTGSASPTSPSASQTAAAESPEEFIRRFVKVKNEMVTTGETTAFLRLAGPECGYCQGFADTVTAIYAEGGRVKTRGWRILSINPRGSSGDQLKFRVRILSAPTDYRESESAPVKHLTGGRSDNLFTVFKRNDGFRVAEVEELAG